MEFNNNKAIYLQIADILIGRILREEYTEEERIISVRECAMEMEVNINTCMRAYEWLCQQNIIYTKRGLGYFVSEGARQAIHREKREEFFENTLPDLQRKMHVLGISAEELMQKLRNEE